MTVLKFDIMKIFFVWIAIFFVVPLNGQTSRSFMIYYGGHHFLPSNGYAHNIGVQKSLHCTRIGTLNGEFSVFYGGPYSFNIKSSNKGIDSKVGPYKALHLTLGTNFEIPLSEPNKSSLSFGFLAGFSRYEIPEVVQTPRRNGASVQVYFDPRNKLLFGGTIRYLQGIKFGNKSFLLIPNFNLYKTSIYTGSIGLLLAVPI